MLNVVNDATTNPMASVYQHRKKQSPPLQAYAAMLGGVPAHKHAVEASREDKVARGARAQRRDVACVWEQS